MSLVPSYLMRISRLLLLPVLWLALLTVPAGAQTESRLALLIGNAGYRTSPLTNPVNDVRLMESALVESGFTVIKAENATVREMRRLVREFGDRLKGSGGVGLFYFAGHGVQVKGDNYLIGVDSDIRNEDEVADDAVNAGVVLEKMESAGNRMNILILDACRDNPFASRSRSSANGLATMNAPSGSLVAYATAPGSVASDGRGGNGLYTEHLARAMRQPGLPVEEVFKQVRTAVRRDSGNQQTPWENTALEGQFFFRAVPVSASAPIPPAQTVTAPVRPAATENSALELALWDSVKSSQSAEELQAYLAQFPSGTFAGVARARLSALRATTVAAAVPSTGAPAPGRVASPAAAGLQSGELGTLVIGDGFSSVKRNLIVIASRNDDQIELSTGDRISAQGLLTQVQIGDVLLRTTAGALWKLPLRGAESGEATVERVDVTPSTSGKVKWRVTPAGQGKWQVDADVWYHTPPPSASWGNQAWPTPIGTWQAIYPESQLWVESYVTQIGIGVSANRSKAQRKQP